MSTSTKNAKQSESTSATQVHEALIELLKLDPVAKGRIEFQEWYAAHVSTSGVNTHEEAEMINKKCEEAAATIASKISYVAKRGMYAEWYKAVKGEVKTDADAITTLKVCAQWLHELLDEMRAGGSSFHLGGIYAVIDHLQKNNTKKD